MRSLVFLLSCWWTYIMMVSGIGREKHHFNMFLSSASQEQQTDVTFLMNFLEISFQQCVIECKLLRKCRFINYYSRTSICELIASSSSNFYVTNKPGVIFGNRADWDLSPLQMCASCDDNERCRPELPGCEIDACGSPEVSNGTILTGNIYKTNARLRYECASGYSIIGSSYITCRDNGQWTSLDTCISNASQCPLTTNYQSTTLNDGTHFKYWLVQAEYNQTGGAALCLECHGRLVEIISPPKLTFLRNILTTKADGFDYWIDGSNADATDYFASDAWTTASGATIPIGDGLWASYAPNHVLVEKCVRLKSEVHYYFDNRKCSELFRVICEYVN